VLHPVFGKSARRRFAHPSEPPLTVSVVILSEVIPRRVTPSGADRGRRRMPSWNQTPRQESSRTCEPASGPICSIPPSTDHSAPVT